MSWNLYFSNYSYLCTVVDAFADNSKRATSIDSDGQVVAVR